MVKHLEGSPVVLVLDSSQYFVRGNPSDGKANDGSYLFSRHNGIVTRRFIDRSQFIFMSSPEDINGKTVFAVIPSDEMRKFWYEGMFLSKMDIFRYIRVLYHGKSILEAGMYDYNCISTYLDTTDVEERLFKEYLHGSLPDKVISLPDKVISESSSGNQLYKEREYENIKELFTKKGSGMDEYQKLINALTLIDPNMVKELNNKLNGMKDSVNPSIVQAIDKMGG